MTFDASRRLLARAQRVIPNGVFGHRRTFAFAGGASIWIPSDYPHFVERAEGCRFWDVDGNEYIDYLCGYGPMIVGYRNPRVEKAVAAEQERGICHDFPGERYLEVAELLTATQKNADWAALALNGTDAVSMALVVARAHTGRSTVVVAENAFHGDHSWSSVGAGRVAADLSETRFVPWGDARRLGEVLSAEPVAAVVLCPYEQLVGAPNRMPAEGFWTEVRRLCDSHGALLIIDDIRSGFRLHPAGSCAFFGIDADLVCVSKAIANGYPLAAAMGTDRIRAAAEEVFVSGTFWGFSPALAAAVETSRILRETNATARMARIGRMLISGLTEVAEKNGFQIRVSGPEAMPLVQLEHDEDYALMCQFVRNLAHQGSFAHPTHNWFLSAAHRAEDVERTLEHAGAAFARMRPRAVETRN
jgi:glutamate-1-semialdehyde 2,1-aminomutase